MPKYNLGDIVLVRFHPAYGQELKKYRPAVIIRDLSAIDTRFVQIAPLTTKASIPKNAFELVINHSALENTSLLLVWYILTFDATRVVHHLGKLKPADISKLKKILAN
jgi:mRNA-degrading endonuclease toxin of MazEF toxin-antitoxin module